MRTWWIVRTVHGLHVVGFDAEPLLPNVGPYWSAKEARIVMEYWRGKRAR